MKKHQARLERFFRPEVILGVLRMLVTTRRLFSLASVLLIFASFSALFGCTHVMKYKPEYLGVPAFDPAHKFNGKCVINTTSSDDSYVFEGPPSSVFGSAETLKIPLGLIAKNAAIRVFEDVCSEVSTADSLDQGNYDIAIYPKPIGFEYFFNDRRHFGSHITPQVVIDLQITAFNSKRDVIFSKVYNSGLVNGKNIYIPMTGWENVNVAAHETMTRLLSTAAEEIVRTLHQ